MVMANTVVFFACISTFVFLMTSQILDIVGMRFLNEYQRVFTDCNANFDGNKFFF